MIKYYNNLFCKCGCGGRIEIKPHHKYYGIPKYINGHQNRDLKKRENQIKRLKGIKKPELSKRMMGNNYNPNFVKYGKDNYFYGKRFTGKQNGNYGKGLFGEKNGRWLGGITNDPYCKLFKDYEWRQLIYDRDSNTCQNCGCTKQLSLKIHSRNLCIHHINHNKLDCVPTNCILLCTRCNVHVENKKLKEYYEEYFYNITKG